MTQLSISSPETGISRRQALKIAAGLAAAGAATATGGLPQAFIAQTVQAQEDVNLDSPAGLPAAPPLWVIALSRMAYGIRPGAFDYGTTFGQFGGDENARFQAFVDWQLNYPAIPDPECDNRLNQMNLPSRGKSLTQLWNDYYNGPNSDPTRPVEDVRAATVTRAVYSRRQLFEMMTEFWHNHFSIYAWDYAYAGATWEHYDRDVIRRYALGNFRQMLGQVAIHPAMLFYLDNYINQVAGFNENWARELCELHTLGVDNYAGVLNPITQPVPKIPFPGGGNFPAGIEVASKYVDNDVYEIARCFTGWRVEDGNWPVQADTGNFLYYEPWHDKANKFVLGRYFDAAQANTPLRDGLDALDLLAYHPGTAKFIVRKLIRRFITDTLPPFAEDYDAGNPARNSPLHKLIYDAANLFVQQRFAADQIAQVMRLILLSDVFKTTWAQKIKRPFESAMSMLRAVNADVRPDYDAFWWNYDDLGQPMFGWRPPNGFPDVKTEWTSTSMMLGRWQFANSALEGWINQWVNNTEVPVVSVNVVNQNSWNTATTIVDNWALRVLGRALASNTNRDELIRFMRGQYSATQVLPGTHIADRLPRMVELLLMSPDFQWR